MAIRKFNPQFKINLVKTFNRAYGSESKELRNALRPTLSSDNFRRIFIEEVIDKIQDRTSKENIDRHGNQLKSYSKSYIESDTFKIYQKSPSDVNLELTGEMLSSLKGVERFQTIIIELIGQHNKDKAHGHVNGLGKRKVKRDFLGLPDEELDIIMINTIEAFRSESFDDAVNLFSGQDIAQQFGQVGNQPEFDSRLSVDSIMMELMRNLNG